MSDSTWIIEPTEDSFAQDVMEASTVRPVIVDFWAKWCGPCRQLAPILESLAQEYAGQFVLAKVDTDAHPGLAGAFQIQSLPTVIAIRDRQLVDLFQGALPESSVRDWLRAILPSLADSLVREGAALEVSSPVEAAARYRSALEADEEHAPARIGLARLLVAEGNLEAAREQLDLLEARGFLEPEAERLKSQIHVQATAAASGGSRKLQEESAARPNDLDLQVRLAEALAAEGATVEALDLCLSVIQRDRSGAGQQAKTAMLDILNTLQNPGLASEYRRKLASALY